MSQQSPVKKRVLVVDDNHDAADLLGMIIEGMGCETTVVYDTQQAYDIARAQKPDVIFHDIGMPITDGYAAARALRELHELDNTLIVALTSYNTTHDRATAYSSGFDFHLAKPVEFTELRHVLEMQRTTPAV